MAGCRSVSSDGWSSTALPIRELADPVLRQR